MALFNFSKRTQAFEDFDENISSEELLNRLKFVFTNVTDLGENVVRIEDLGVDIWHQQGGFFLFETRLELPDFMQKLSDEDIIKCCNDINNQKLITCYFYKTDDSIRVLAFRNIEFFIRNIADINKLGIMFYQIIDTIMKELEKKFQA